MRKETKIKAAATCLLVVMLLIAGIPAGSRDVLATNTNYALNGTVTSSNTNASLAASYPVVNLTDGISASNGQGDENAIINYLDNGLGYYEIAMKSVATLNQVRVYFSDYEPEKRPKDMAVDLKKSDGTWVRAAEMQNVDYGTDLTVADGAKYLAFDFQPVNDVAVIRVTANKLRNGSTNFRLMEVEAYNDETITTYTNYAIPVVEEDADDTQSENLVLGKTPTTPSGRGVGNIGRITDGNTGYEGSTNAYVLYGAASLNNHENNEAYYQFDFEAATMLNSVKVYLYNGETDRRPQDIAVDVKLANGTWKRVATRYAIVYSGANAESITVDANRDGKPESSHLEFCFEEEECVAFRLTANRQRVRATNASYTNSTLNWMLTEIEAYHDATITEYTGIETESNEAYAIDILEPKSDDTDTDVDTDTDSTSTENLVLGKIPTTPSERTVGFITRITDGNTGYEGSTNAYVLYGAGALNNHESNETYYQFDFETATKLNFIKLYLYAGETAMRPQDIAVDVKLADGTWKRVATRYAIAYSGANAESITVDANRDGKPESSHLEFTFEEEECVAFRLTSNRQRVRATNDKYTNSTLNWMLTEIEAYYDSTITEYTGIETESNEAYAILMPESNLDNDGDTDTGGDTDTDSSTDTGSDSDGTDSPTTSTMKNYALNGVVTSSNLNSELAAKYPASQATDGVPYYTREAGQTSVINYQDNGLAYYQVALKAKAKINQVRVYFNQAEPEKRPKDIAVDVQTENGTWVRVAEMHNINYDEALVVTDNPRYLAFNFEAVDNVKNIRVTANQKRNSSTNFRIMEIEAYLDTTITTYTGTIADANASYNIPEVGKETTAGTTGGTSGSASGGKNYALNGKVTSSNTNASLEAGYPAAQATDGVTPYTREAGQTAVINYQANGLAYYEVELSQKAKINQVRVYFNMAEPEKRPKDIAVDIKKADGTWVRAAEMHNIDYDKALVVTDNPRYLAFNFEALEATTIRVTANQTRNRSDSTNFRIMEIEAYLDTSITTYTGVKQDANEAYNIPLLSTDDTKQEETDAVVKEEQKGEDDKTVFESDENVNTTAKDTKEDHKQLIQTTGALIGTTLLVSILGIAAYLIWSKKQKKKTLEGKNE